MSHEIRRKEKSDIFFEIFHVDCPIYIDQDYKNLCRLLTATILKSSQTMLKKTRKVMAKVHH